MGWEFLLESERRNRKPARVFGLQRDIGHGQNGPGDHFYLGEGTQLGMEVREERTHAVREYHNLT